MFLVPVYLVPALPPHAHHDAIGTTENWQSTVTDQPTVTDLPTVTDQESPTLQSTITDQSTVAMTTSAQPLEDCRVHPDGIAITGNQFPICTCCCCCCCCCCC